MAAILKAICAGVGFGSGTETTIVRKIDVFGGNIRDSQLERIASTQEVYSREERLCLLNAGGGGDFATQLMCGDFPLLLLKDASSKDYIYKAVFRLSLGL